MDLRALVADGLPEFRSVESTAPGRLTLHWSQRRKIQGASVATRFSIFAIIVVNPEGILQAIERVDTQEEGEVRYNTDSNTAVYSGAIRYLLDHHVNCNFRTT